VGFVVDKVALGQVFSQYFGFPCQSSFHQFLHNHHHHRRRGGKPATNRLSYGAAKGPTCFKTKTNFSFYK
jgi:hypothetical protein